MIIWGLLLFAQLSLANPISAYVDNNKGAKLLEQERAFEAGQVFIDGLASSPYQAEIHLNLGLAFEKQKELPKALSEYKEAIRLSPNEAVKFSGLFNAARVLGEQGQVGEALSFYQHALTIDPESKEVKTNIELLLAQGGGAGKGQKKDKNQKGKGEGDNQDDNQERPQNPGQQDQKQPKREQPREFKSEDLSQSDVRKILEELKNQEQKIRRKEYDKKAKEAPGGKDW